MTIAASGASQAAGPPTSIHPYISDVIESVESSAPSEPEFAQSVREVLESLSPVIARHPEFAKAKILERLVEPERVIQFRVSWVDDRGEVQVNRGYRIQFNSSIGPYKGGLRFHPSVSLSILKFLGFEQIFKNALTTLPIGGGKGGSNFDPKGRSDNEVMAFCQAFMSELYRHIGENVDVPAGDIGVGGREIGYLYGMYRKLKRDVTGVLTGKGLGWGGSLIRPEATGYGCVYFAANMLETHNQSIEGKTCLVSGSGNVAQFTVEKINQLGGKVVSLSDSSGYIHDPEGIDDEKLAWVKDLKNLRRGRIREYAEQFPSASYHGSDRSLDHNPLWAIPADCAFPSATQNEINATDAQHLIAGGVKLVAEGANMPTTAAGQDVFMDAKILYAPAKAANAGGVAVSALEMAQNSQRLYWSREEVDSKLRGIMKTIHDTSLGAAESYGLHGNYVAGANIAGFLKVARAMVDQGIV